MSKLSICFLLCAWIMWQEVYVKKVKAGTEILSAFETREECESGLERLVDRRKKQGKKVEGSTITMSATTESSLICLPDTIKHQ